MSVEKIFRSRNGGNILRKRKGYMALISIND